MRSKELSRRRFLRGAAGAAVVSVGLPRLSPMLDSGGQAWAAGTRPIRYVTWGFGNGVVPSLWTPKTTGAGAAWQLSPALAPLAAWKPYLTVVGNMKVEGSSQHGCGNLCFLTGQKATTERQPLGPTFDQVVAAETRKVTPLKSLEVGVVNNPEDRRPGNLSWSHNGRDSINHPSYDVGEVFDRLFGPTGVGAGIGGGTATPMPVTGPSGETIRRARKSVLDFVMADARRLRTALPAADRARLDQHLEGVFALEQRIAGVEAAPVKAPAGGCARPVVKRMIGGGSLDAASAEVNAAMAKLLALAFACDLTRVATFQITQAASKCLMPEIGVTSWHELSHEPEHQEKIQKVVLRHMEYLAVLVKTLHETPDGAGTLLDNVALMTVNDVAEGWNHTGLDMPVLIVGKAGGRLKGDLHHRGPADLASVACLTVGRAVIDLPSFGVGAYARTNPIGELLA